MLQERGLHRAVTGLYEMICGHLWRCFIAMGSVGRISIFLEYARVRRPRWQSRPIRKLRHARHSHSCAQYRAAVWQWSRHVIPTSASDRVVANDALHDSEARRSVVWAWPILYSDISTGARAVTAACNGYLGSRGFSTQQYNSGNQVDR